MDAEGGNGRTTERTGAGQTGLLPGMPEFQALDPDLPARLRADLAEAEEKAWDSLARYKFQMFGYWSAIWVHLNRVGRFGRPNPWRELVRAARERRGKMDEED